jgi:hypothetical protein
MRQMGSLLGTPIRRMVMGCPLAFGLLFGVATYAQTPTHSPPSSMTCPGDTIVWINTKSHVYHYEGERYFGSTQQGKFICEKAAVKEGDRPTRDGQ